MNAIYQVNTDELDQSFLDALKAMFKNKEIEITVSERDETAYLLRSPGEPRTPSARGRRCRKIAKLVTLFFVLLSLPRSSFGTF